MQPKLKKNRALYYISTDRQRRMMWVRSRVSLDEESHRFTMETIETIASNMKLRRVSLLRYLIYFVFRI